MNSRWEGIVYVAREVDGAFAQGTPPDSALVMRLARAVLDFQQHLAGNLVRPQPPPRVAPQPDIPTFSTSEAAE